MPDLRETVARVAFETEVGYAPDDRAWERAGEYWLGFADKILAIPELTRPTADLGEDGELERKLRRTSIETVFDDLENSGRRETRSLLVNPDGLEAADRIELYREALVTAEAEARRFAGLYPEGSDGRNTFVIFADKIAVLSRSGG